MTDSDTCPKILLAGNVYGVPPIALREMSEIVPAVLALRKQEAMSQAQIELLGRIAYLGIKGSAPSVSYEQFLNLPVTLQELMEALPVVSRQAGMKSKEPSPSGEAAGVTSPQISS